MALQAVIFPTKPVVQAHLIINCILVSIAVAVVGLRLISRFVSGAKLWWDDFLILLSVPQGVGMLIIQGLYSPMGIGYPITETLPNLVIILKLTFAYALIYTVCICTIKLSVLCFYLRVFVTDGMRLATKIVIAFVSLWSVANILILLFICRPVAKTYDPSVQGTCGDQPSAFISIGAFTAQHPDQTKQMRHWDLTV
ncbi:hypothetical protein PT974_03028 [Cladobotryum mycophilum]|uniref:Rhodopsin domain-containing protein n=1 Tax=Cladobotryum mycophilum TaxID=491253 RepID=A0ABR0SW82_9HYPO